MKKILILFILLFICFFSSVIFIKTKAATGEIIVGHVINESNEVINFTSIKLDIYYSQTDCFDESMMCDLSLYKSIYPDINGSYSFECDFDFKIIVDLKTLPTGFGVLKADYLKINQETISIDKVENIYMNGKGYEFVGSAKKAIVPYYTNYIEQNENNTIHYLNVNGLERSLSETIQLDINNYDNSELVEESNRNQITYNTQFVSINFSNLEYSFLFIYEDSNSRNIPTETIITNTVKDVEDFFVSIDYLDTLLVNTSSNISISCDFTNSNLDASVTSISFDNNGFNATINLNLKNITNSIDFEKIISHEYTHLITKAITTGAITNTSVDEPLAEFFSFYNLLEYLNLDVNMIDITKEKTYVEDYFLSLQPVFTDYNTYSYDENLNTYTFYKRIAEFVNCNSSESSIYYGAFIHFLLLCKYNSAVNVISSIKTCLSIINSIKSEANDLAANVYNNYTVGGNNLLFNQFLIHIINLLSNINVMSFRNTFLLECINYKNFVNSQNHIEKLLYYIYYFIDNDNDIPYMMNNYNNSQLYFLPNEVKLFKTDTPYNLYSIFIQTNDNISIKFYDESKTLIEQSTSNNFYSIIFGDNLSYYYVVFENLSSTNNIINTIYLDTINSINEFNSNLHQTDNHIELFSYLNYNELYRININNLDLTNYVNITNVTSNDSPYLNLALNNGDNSKYFYSKKSNLYYIEFDTSSNNSLNISDVSVLNSTEGDFYEDSILNYKITTETAGVGFGSFNFKSYGTFNHIVELINYNYTVPVYIFKKNNNGINLLTSTTLNSSNRSTIVLDDIYYGDDIIFIYPGNYFNTNINMIFETNVIENQYYNYSLIPDGGSSALGTEVTVLHHPIGLNTITKGFTRCMYLTSTAPSPYRQDYYWYSSNQDILEVSKYGTVFAKGIGTAIIYCVFKYEMSIRSSIAITSSEDLETDIVHLNYGIDIRETNPHTGTDVTENGRPIVAFGSHLNEIVYVTKGYTRLICLGNDAPTNILQNYTWTSNSTDVIVTAYGTIIGVDNTNSSVLITGTYNYDERFIVEILVMVEEV